MSESAARAVRRDIRRAFGEQATQAITARDQAINELRTLIASMHTSIEQLEDQHPQDFLRLTSRINALTPKAAWWQFWKR